MAKANKERQPKEHSPASVVARVMGCGKFEAERLAAKLGTKANELPKLYAEGKGTEIRNTLAAIDSPVDATPAAGPAKKTRIKSVENTNPA